MVATTTGERYDVKHKPVVDENSFTSEARCLAILPSGEKCDRRLNFVVTGYTGPSYEPDGHWRHNPRPVREPMTKSYLGFVEQGTFERRKTKTLLVYSLSSGVDLGTILWRGGWRQYVFEPEPDTVWSDGCMAEIQTKIRELMAARKAA